MVEILADAFTKVMADEQLIDEIEKKGQTAKVVTGNALEAKVPPETRLLDADGANAGAAAR